MMVERSLILKDPSLIKVAFLLEIIECFNEKQPNKQEQLATLG